MIGKNSTARADCIGGNRTLLGKQTESDEMLGQLTVGLFPYEFVARQSPPEINPGTLEELASNAAEKLNQRMRIRAFPGFLGDAKK
jgi:hypothetical protein